MKKWRDFIAQLFKSEYNKLFAVAYRLVKNVTTAEDLVQETFFLAIFHQQTMLDHPNPEGWLMITLKNLALNELRRAENRLTVPLEDITSLSAPDSGRTVETLLPAGLSSEDRQILIWRIGQQMSYRDMALRLGISEVGCRSRVARAVARCRKLLDISDLQD